MSEVGQLLHGLGATARHGEASLVRTRHADLAIEIHVRWRFPATPPAAHTKRSAELWHLGCLLAPVVDPAPEGDSLEVYVDGGIRRGKDIVRALALGATAAFCGRPHQWGLSVGGQAGAERVVEIFREELTMCMQLAGCDDVTGLDRDCVMVSPKRSFSCPAG